MSRSSSRSAWNASSSCASSRRRARISRRLLLGGVAGGLEEHGRRGADLRVLHALDLVLEPLRAPGTCLWPASRSTSTDTGERSR